MKNQEPIIAILKAGGIGVLPTDTIYGVVGSALAKNTVQRIYKLRHRNPKKPMIVLISKMDDLNLFGAEVSPEDMDILEKIWPGKVSVVLKIKLRRLKYLHRGKNTLAFRLPRDKRIAAVLKESGPLVAPSANLEGKPPAQNIKQAMRYFGDRVDFYFDAGTVRGESSALISLNQGKVKLLRGRLRLKKL